MKKPITALGILITMMVLLASSQADASPKHKSFHDHESGQRGINAERVLHHLLHLDLSEQQKIDIQALVEQNKKASQSKQNEIKQLHKKLSDLSKSNSIDEQSIKSVSQEIANIKSDLLIMRLNKRSQIKQLLNEEQKEQFAKMKKKHRRSKE